MVRYFLLSLVFLLSGTIAIAQTSLQGKVTDVETGEELIGANIVLTLNGVYSAGTSTDFDGNYSVNVDPGTYDVEVSYIGFPTNKITDVVVKAGQANKLNVKLNGEDAGITLDDVIVTAYKVPLIEQDNTTSGQTITSDQIRSLPTKDVTAIAASAAGISQADEGDDVSIRGSRDNATDYYIDGIRVRGSGNLIPQSEIDQLQVITGGIEAQYGDVTGGIISITTKGPSSRYTGGVEIETSEFLDPYGYNLVSANVSGPILKKKESGETIIGFRLSGQYLDRKDDDPPATDIYKVKDDVLANLEANPIRRLGATKIPAAQFLGADDVEVLDYQPNEQSTRLDLTAKLDARLTKNIDITLTGSYNDAEDKFTPGENNSTGVNWRLLNSQNNPTDFETQYRGNFRFRHRLGGTDYSAEGAGDEASARKSSIIQNAQYTLMGAYEKREYDLFDPRHKDRLFDYGHVGQFDYTWAPVAAFGQQYSQAPFGIAHVDNQQQFTGYNASGSANPGLSAYNDVVDAGNINDFVALNGQFNGSTTSAWGFHTNVNQVYNLFRKRESNRLTLNVTSSFDFLPGGSEKGRHSIQFGILYEQRYSRAYDINPRRLWTIARQQANRHILGVDTSLVIGKFDPGLPFSAIPGVDSIDVFGTQFTSPDLLFYQKVRQITGQGLGEYVNVDALRPDQLSLNLFSAQELNDQFSQIDLEYYGYDYLGNNLGNDVTFDDFFTARDANGLRSFPVAAFNPIYAAAYIQDKFTFKDIIFRLGVRVDRYDANTKVLKDLYSLYSVQNAGDFYGGIGEQKPAGVEDDYLVYVNGPGSNEVTAFRKGDQWYFADGNPANDGNVIFGGQVVTPKLINDEANIKDENFDPNESFVDYEPQLNWMPRLAFSFPISDAANFFAHYDILVQRPPSNSYATPLDYFYFNENPGSDGAPFNNPDLKPEKTIDYEVGFQQRLSNSSAIKIAAYYKEMRDMIQRRSILFVPAPINNYTTYGNLDFGTVKGFSFQYDLRRTGNVSLQANYTLQFADGTGSDANSQRGLTSRGNLRTLFPLNFDERHRIVTSIDYRYDSGKKYNGPVLFGKDILSDFGANLQAIAVSGRPYTAKQIPDKLGGSGTVGQINGSRLPWNFTLNLRLDKSFSLTGPEAKSPLHLNVYLRVQNILDRRNIIRVYPASGSPYDDGYLDSRIGVQEIETLENSGLDVDSFLNSYQWRVLNPNFFSLPRRIFLGAVFEF